MKTKLFFATAAVALISLSSCKKDYVCECEVETSGISTPIDVAINDSKKSDAEDACDSAETTYGSGASTASCTLTTK
jgi:hypothetical protein